MDADTLKSYLAESGVPPYRAKQVLQAVYRDGASSYEEILSLPAALRKELAEAVPIQSLSPVRTAVSADGRAHKALLRLRDGKVIESVLLKPKPDDTWSTCISSQVGCAMGCTFCATGLMGLERNLDAEEIADQVLFWRQYLRSKRIRGRLTNVVYMGMGEPFHTLDNLFASLRVLLDPERLGLAARHVSVSTVGLVQGFERLAEEFPQVNLALSLHAGDENVRAKLVPVSRAYPLKELRTALKRYLDRTNRKVFLEYVLLAGENDGLEHARQAARFVKSVGRPGLLHVNLIVWNPTDTPHERPGRTAARVFRDELRRAGVAVTIRRNLGTDIQGACGQLVTGEPKERPAPTD